MRDVVGVLAIAFTAGMTILGVRLTISNPKLAFGVCAIGTLLSLLVGFRYPFSRLFVEGSEKKSVGTQSEKV